MSDIGTTIKNDSIVQTRCKRTDLATLALYFEKGQQLRIRTLSELVRETIQMLAVIVSENGYEVVEETAQATQVLLDRGLSTLNSNYRGKRNLYNNLLFEDRKLEHTYDSGMSKMDEVVKNAMKNFKPEVLQSEEDKERMKEVKKSLGLVPNNVKGGKKE
jgi:hypothetical protein